MRQVYSYLTQRHPEFSFLTVAQWQLLLVSAGKVPSGSEPLPIGTMFLIVKGGPTQDTHSWSNVSVSAVAEDHNGFVNGGQSGFEVEFFSTSVELSFVLFSGLFIIVVFLRGAFLLTHRRHDNIHGI